MRRFLFCVLFAIFAACATVGGFRESYLRSWWIPLDPTQRSRTVYEQVVFLESPPTDRKYRAIGKIHIPSDYYYSQAELINAARAAGSLYGASAVFGELKVETGWKVDAWSGWTAGANVTNKRLTFEGKGIVWE